MPGCTSEPMRTELQVSVWPKERPERVQVLGTSGPWLRQVRGVWRKDPRTAQRSSLECVSPAVIPRLLPELVPGWGTSDGIAGLDLVEGTRLRSKLL